MEGEVCMSHTHTCTETSKVKSDKAEFYPYRADVSMWPVS